MLMPFSHIHTVGARIHRWGGIGRAVSAVRCGYPVCVRAGADTLALAAGATVGAATGATAGVATIAIAGTAAGGCRCFDIDGSGISDGSSLEPQG